MQTSTGDSPSLSAYKSGTMGHSLSPCDGTDEQP